MNGILDNSLVGLALLASAGYAAASLGPRSLRRRMLGAMSRAVARAPRFLGLRRLSARLAAASGRVQGACGGCNSCGSEQPPGSKADNARAADVSIPASKIGRRD